MILLATLNSQYVHSNLAVRYLAGIPQTMGLPVRLFEFTVNDDRFQALRAIADLEPALVGLSCYIWNIEPTLKLARDLKQIRPDCKILLGGPEVSFDADRILAEAPWIDFIIRGEGEETFREFLKLGPLESPETIPGLSWRDGDRIYSNPERQPIQDFALVPSPYSDNMALDGRILYYETSRGCPFRCAYCMSSLERTVRNFPLERVFAELTQLAARGPGQIKFVDRTFNSQPERAAAILRFLLTLPGNTNYHFEINGDLLTDELIDLLNAAPAGKFQIEVGVQSTNPETLQAVGRHQNLERLAENVQRLQANGTVHMHLDLIAGLPYDDLTRFGAAFNRVYQLKPDHFQLGFLKLLKGSPLSSQVITDPAYANYRCRMDPPYEFLTSPWLSFKEVSGLKTVERLLNRYYNSGAFPFSLSFIIHTGFDGDPFAFYTAFAEMAEAEGWAIRSTARIRHYYDLNQFVRQYGLSNQAEILDLINFDFVLTNFWLDLPSDLRPGAAPEQALRKYWLNQARELPFTGKPVLTASGGGKDGLRVECFEKDVLGLTGLSDVVRKGPAVIAFQRQSGRILAQYLDGEGTE
ncbi:MAG: DUF4080 domain-containing protein [Solirubrobacterales bacterium]